jgi:hypothetical protein
LLTVERSAWLALAFDCARREQAPDAADAIRSRHRSKRCRGSITIGYVKHRFANVRFGKDAKLCAPQHKFRSAKFEA